MNALQNNRSTSITETEKPAASVDSLRFAEILLKQRALRMDVLFNTVIADTEWFILLELFVAERAGNRLSVSDIYYVAGVPKSTVIRAIDRLVHSNHLAQALDPVDARRRLVWLQPSSRLRLDTLLVEMASIGSPP